MVVEKRLLPQMTKLRPPSDLVTERGLQLQMIAFRPLELVPGSHGGLGRTVEPEPPDLGGVACSWFEGK